MAIRVFVSHSVLDLDQVKEIRDKLELHGFQVFIAHEDIDVSEVWRKRILDELENCDIALALLTKNFKESDWADQEMGIAYHLGKVIVSLCGNVSVYGFLDEFQACPIGSHGIEPSCNKIITAIRKKPGCEDRYRQGVVDAFCSSKSYTDAAHRSKVVTSLNGLEIPQMNQIVRAGFENNNLTGSYVAEDFIKNLIDDHRGFIDEGLINQWESTPPADRP